MTIVELTQVKGLLRIPELKCDIIVTRDKNEYCPGNTINVSNVITNVGNKNVIGNLVSRILDPADTTINSTSWTNLDVLIGESRTFNAYYTVQGDETPGGEYKADGNFSFDEKFCYARSNTFWILSSGIGDFDRFRRNIDVAILPGDFESRQIFVWLQHACENATVYLNVSLGEPGDWVTFHPDEVPLILIDDTSVINQTIVNITVPPGQNTGIYNGTIYYYVNGQLSEKYTNLTVTVQGLVFKINVTVEKEKVCIGDTIPAKINVTKNTPGFLYVNMSYQIRNSTDAVFDEFNKTFQLNMSSLRNITLTVPNDAKPGYYSFSAFLQHNLTRVRGDDLFEVMECPGEGEAEGEGEGEGELPTPLSYNISLNLSTNLLTGIIGNKTSFVATVNNTGTGTVKSIRISTEGIPLKWITSSPYRSDISPAEKQDYLVTITIPKDAEPGIRVLKVKATDEVESNTEFLKLIIGKNYKEIADLLLKEVEIARMNANESLLVEKCLDITIIESIFNDAEIAYEKALKEYANGNYEKSVNWLEYAIPIYENVIDRVDITLEMEIETSKTSRYIIPTVFKPEKFFDLAMQYLKEKNYKEICQPITGIRRLIMMSLIFWPGIIILIIVLIVVAFIVYRKKREQARILTLERVRKRLENISTSEE